MSWQELYRRSMHRPHAIDALTEAAITALLSSGITAVQKVVAANPASDVSLLCAVLDRHAIALPENVENDIERLSNGPR